MCMLKSNIVNPSWNYLLWKTNNNKFHHWHKTDTTKSASCSWSINPTTLSMLQMLATKMPAFQLRIAIGDCVCVCACMSTRNNKIAIELPPRLERYAAAVAAKWPIHLHKHVASMCERQTAKRAHLNTIYTAFHAQSNLRESVVALTSLQRDENEERGWGIPE